MKCPRCNEDISSMLPKGISDKEVRFCPLCGKNFRYKCTSPNCNGIISIIGIGTPNPDEIRCPECNSLFYVCEKCGRLAEPDEKKCPECGAMLLSYDLSSYTYNGTGFYDDFKLKFSLENKYTTQITKDIKCQELHSAKIIGGYIFIWHDSIIDKFDLNSNFKKLESIPTYNAEKSNISPCMTLLGDNIILASKDKFLWFINDSIKIDKVKGKPVALISGHCGVAMWTEYENHCHLYTALFPKRNNAPDINEIEFHSSDYELLINSPLAMTKTKLYWQGKTGNIYSYDFFAPLNTSPIKEIKFEKGKITKIWVDPFDKISVAVTDPNNGNNIIYENIEDNQPIEKITDNGKLYIYPSPESNKTEYVHILKNATIKFNEKNEYLVPNNGKHIYSILCQDQNNKLALLSVFKHVEGSGEYKYFSLFANGKDNINNVDYICNKIEDIEEPIELMCYQDKIFVLNKKGIKIIEREENNSIDTKNNTVDDIDEDSSNNNFEESQEDLSINGTNFDVKNNITETEKTTEKTIEEPKKKFDTNKLPKETLPQEEMNKIKMRELLEQLKSKKS